MRTYEMAKLELDISLRGLVVGKQTISQAMWNYYKQKYPDITTKWESEIQIK